MYLWQLLNVLKVLDGTGVTITVRQQTNDGHYMSIYTIYRSFGLDGTKIEWYYRQLEVIEVLSNGTMLDILLRELV